MRPPVRRAGGRFAKYSLVRFARPLYSDRVEELCLLPSPLIQLGPCSNRALGPVREPNFSVTGYGYPAAGSVVSDWQAHKAFLIKEKVRNCSIRGSSQGVPVLPGVGIVELSQQFFLVWVTAAPLMVNGKVYIPITILRTAIGMDLRLRLQFF